MQITFPFEVILVTVGKGHVIGKDWWNWIGCLSPVLILLHTTFSFSKSLSEPTYCCNIQTFC